ncbi:fam-h protein [Plasmodium relictum]|uniref:Fam-h protein n=1 Tax=Plasmodium relictum TaxID=85471 RepID=A0A1J1GK90_PLARL|nr:fam-h protein [Plasmodium relictum]CRG84862.1 fam-h protein [Plasmodium relictum]
MNRKNNIILIPNFRIHPRYYSHVTKGFNGTHISTLEIYCKREKKNILYFLINFFIFTLSIWILQCSNNWDSCKSWNYKNKLNNTLNLVAKRSLAENDCAIKQKEGSSQCYNQKDMMTINLEQRNEQNEIEQNMNVEPECEIETKEKNKKEKFNRGILYKCKNNLKLASLLLSILLSLSSFSSYLVGMFTFTGIQEIELFLFASSFLIVSTILIYERIEIKYKNKF